jgi:glyoxylase-like metal-dependent hydrolase (beta-lactamase superfamily II)
MPRLLIEKLELGPLPTNAYLLANEQTREALVVDPGFEPERICAALDEREWTVAAYLITHGHFDHVTALADMVAVRPAPVGIHSADAAWAFSPLTGRFQFFPTPKAPPRIDRNWQEGQSWTDAGLTYSVIETPGHSPGGVCFYFELQRLLVAGDTLFAGSIGRLDLPLAEPKAMSGSLRKLMKLPDDVLVLPGHGPATTIGDERAGNPFIREMAP